MHHLMPTLGIALISGAVSMTALGYALAHNSEPTLYPPGHQEIVVYADKPVQVDLQLVYDEHFLEPPLNDEHFLERLLSTATPYHPSSTATLVVSTGDPEPPQRWLVLLNNLRGVEALDGDETGGKYICGVGSRSDMYLGSLVQVPPFTGSGCESSPPMSTRRFRTGSTLTRLYMRGRHNTCSPQTSEVGRGILRQQLQAPLL
jgi:hypothetical protein